MKLSASREEATTAGSIHPSALIEPGARLDPSVSVGAFAVIGGRVQLGARTVVGPHAVLQGRTTLGADNWIGPHAVLGTPPQVRGEEGEGGALIIGQGNRIRELATIHAARPGGETILGDGNMLMAYAHVAHDCRLGNHIELANGVQLAGHVVLEDHVGIGGLAAVHQYVHIGTGAFVGAGSMVSQDVLPYSLVSGDRARTYGINRVGLQRQEMASGRRRELARALRLLLGATALREGIERVRAELSPSLEVEQLLTFALASRRGICRPILERREPDEA